MQMNIILTGNGHRDSPWSWCPQFTHRTDIHMHLPHTWHTLSLAHNNSRVHYSRVWNHMWNSIFRSIYLWAECADCNPASRGHCTGAVRYRDNGPSGAGLRPLIFIQQAAKQQSSGERLLISLLLLEAAHKITKVVDELNAESCTWGQSVKLAGDQFETDKRKYFCSNQ